MWRQPILDMPGDLLAKSGLRRPIYEVKTLQWQLSQSWKSQAEQESLCSSFGDGRARQPGSNFQQATIKDGQDRPGCKGEPPGIGANMVSPSMIEIEA